MAVAPRALVIDGVAFPIQVTAGTAHIAGGVPALEALLYVLAQFTGADVPPERRECFARGKDFVVPELAAVRTTADDPDAGPGVATWHDFCAGAVPLAPQAEIYLVSAGFVRTALAVPAPIMVRLAAALVRLCDDLRAGRLTPPAPDAPAAAAPAPPTEPAEPAEPALAPDEVLHDLERRATALDLLDPDAVRRAGPAPEQLDAVVTARRRTLLIGLRTACLLSPSAVGDPALAWRLAADGLVTLAGYVDAARALQRYLRSDARARVLPAVPVTDLLLADVSLDWFRTPQATPPSLSSEAWLAVCEHAFVRDRPDGPRAARTYTRIEGVGVWLHSRAGLGPHKSLWRAVLT